MRSEDRSDILRQARDLIAEMMTINAQSARKENAYGAGEGAIRKRTRVCQEKLDEGAQLQSKLESTLTLLQWKFKPRVASDV